MSGLSRVRHQVLAAVAAILLPAINPSLAAPVSYTFTTGPTDFAGVALGSSPGTIVPTLPLFGGAAGSFLWDSAGSFVQTNPDGSSAYAGFTSPSITGLTPSVSGLSASIGGFAFSDPVGSTSVWNDKTPPGFFGTAANSDALILAFDPPAINGGTFTRNLSGFDVDGWHLISARMLWIEGLDMTFEANSPGTGPIADFLSDQSLPGTLPAFSGRLWLEFQNNADPSQFSFVFYNNLQVHPTAPIPEPETYAMLLAGLGLLGFEIRRRRKLRPQRGARA